MGQGYVAIARQAASVLGDPGFARAADVYKRYR
jgi:hypothetical protein